MRLLLSLAMSVRVTLDDFSVVCEVTFEFLMTSVTLLGPFDSRLAFLLGISTRGTYSEGMGNRAQTMRCHPIGDLDPTATGSGRVNSDPLSTCRSRQYISQFRCASPHVPRPRSLSAVGDVAGEYNGVGILTRLASPVTASLHRPVYSPR